MFICQFDIFGRGRHIYTFENFCSEDKEIALNDGTAKVFLNATGKMDDINGELKAFLDYVAGKESQDAFVEKLKEAVKQAKKNRKWRHEYMTLWMRDLENFDRGIQKGIRLTIESGNELGVDRNRMLAKVAEKYELDEVQAEEYMDKYWK